MKQTIKLSTPLKITGKNYSELSYDLDEIDGALFMEAETRTKKNAINSGNAQSAMLNVMETNTALHLMIGCAAIIAINKEIDWADLERIKGRDLVKIITIGRSFFSASEATSKESSSEEPTETTHESTIQA